MTRVAIARAIPLTRSTIGALVRAIERQAKGIALRAITRMIDRTIGRRRVARTRVGSCWHFRDALTPVLTTDGIAVQFDARGIIGAAIARGHRRTQSAITRVVVRVASATIWTHRTAIEKRTMRIIGGAIARGHGRTRKAEAYSIFGA